MTPALLAAIAQAALPIVQYVISLPEVERQAAIDALNAAAKSSSAAVDAFVAGSAADLADAQARLAAISQHPAVAGDSQLAADVAAIRAQLVERFTAPLPSGQLVDTSEPQGSER